MPAPSLDRIPADQSMPTPPRRRRRPLALLTAGTLVVLATALGVSVALATRPSPTPAPSAAASPDTTAAAPADTAANAPAAPSAKADQPADPAAETTAPRPAVLDDGEHHAYVRKVDAGRDTVVVDVVQVFLDDAAVKAAIEDGVKPADAKFKTVHLRNENPRLRTLPLAGDVRVDLIGCGEEASLGRDALLAKLAGNARSGSFYYTLTVDRGAVRQIDEKVAGNAC
jgi:hypothetical protein